jgi:hypothetical protein
MVQLLDSLLPAGQLVQKVTQAQLVPRLQLLVQQDHQAVLLAPSVRLVLQVQLVLQAQLVYKAQRDHKVLLDLQAHKVFKVFKVKLARQARQAHKV